PSCRDERVFKSRKVREIRRRRALLPSREHASPCANRVNEAHLAAAVTIGRATYGFLQRDEGLRCVWPRHSFHQRRFLRRFCCLLQSFIGVGTAASWGYAT